MLLWHNTNVESNYSFSDNQISFRCSFRQQRRAVSLGVVLFYRHFLNYYFLQNLTTLY